MIKRIVFKPISKVLALMLVYLSATFWLNVNAQHQSVFADSISELPVCLYHSFQYVLDSFYQVQLAKNKSRLSSRSNNDKFELRLYVDTSYERRLTGVYNKNDSVTVILNKVVDSVRWLYNNASAYWDIDTETEIIFFDGATPFSYGANSVETLINFYLWLDANNYPGNDDNYVFYSGNYTNQGVSFVGELCLPGVSMVGFVANFNSNVDLSSHEWIGHSANSYHYNNEPNIMNSIAQRPWKSESVTVVDSFFDAQNCFINAQAPLSLDFLQNPITVVDNKISLSWNFQKFEGLEGFRIERKLNSQNWTWLSAFTKNTNYTDLPVQNGLYQYKIHAFLQNGQHLESSIQTIKFNSDKLSFIKNNQLLNPEFNLIRIYDFTGRMLCQSRNSQIDLKKYRDYNYILIQIESGIYKWFTISD